MAIKYGRGKHLPHENYINYMNEIVKDPQYEFMPNSVSENGRVNWQVSSGKNTSFYEYYLKRFEWWENKANTLRLLGTGNSDGRFTIAARMIHPTGRKPCRLCGVERYVGYMYTNHLLSKRWNKILGSHNAIIKGMDIVNVVEILLGEMETEKVMALIQQDFKERSAYFYILPDVDSFFNKTHHIPSSLLSPGFMGNPPDRLDGFHDYGLCCRKEKDPGRFDDNMRSYSHDRRAFQYWAEGDWIVADALYNQASEGKCSGCNESVGKISPDHIGPLSCGFKQIPFFEPLCIPCNLSKNRRFTYNDVKKLLEYEHKTKDSVVSWQVRGLWDNAKISIKNDSDAKMLSNYMRSLQDYYIRFLSTLKNKGLSMLLSYYLNPKNAFYTVVFENLDSSKLTYTNYQKVYAKTASRTRLAVRSMRIAFEELENYPLKERKVRDLEFLDYEKMDGVIEKMVTPDFLSKLPKYDMVLWTEAVNNVEGTFYKEKAIGELLFHENYGRCKSDFYELIQSIQNYFNIIGDKAYQQFIKEL